MVPGNDDKGACVQVVDAEQLQQRDSRLGEFGRQPNECEITRNENQADRGWHSLLDCFCECATAVVWFALEAPAMLLPMRTYGEVRVSDMQDPG